MEFASPESKGGAPEDLIARRGRSSSLGDSPVFALSSATRALRPLRVGGVPEHFNTPWHTAHAAGRFDELGLQVDSWIAGHEGPSFAGPCSF